MILPLEEPTPSPGSQTSDHGWNERLPYRSAMVIDLHCHVLPGIDDGPATMEGSIALGAAAAAAGTSTIVATPHVSGRYSNNGPMIARLVAETNAEFASAGIGVEILPGAEIASSQIAKLKRSDLATLTLGGGPWLLIECPFTGVADSLSIPLLYLNEEGYKVVLAHPERCPGFHRDPQILRSLIGSGMLTSITAGSLVGEFGETVRRVALGLVDEGLVHNVASDAHDHLRRPPTIAGQLHQAGLGPLADWLTHAVPAAILRGGEVPPRPNITTVSAPRSRRPWHRRP